MMQLLHPVDRMPCPKRLALGEADPALFDKEPKASPKRRLAHPDKGSNPRLRRARFKQGAFMYASTGRTETAASGYARKPPLCICARHGIKANRLPVLMACLSTVGFSSFKLYNSPFGYVSVNVT